MTDLVKVHDPKKPGDFLLVNAKAFDEGSYKLFSEPLKKEAPKAAVRPAVKTSKPAAKKRAVNRPK